MAARASCEYQMCMFWYRKSMLPCPATTCPATTAEHHHLDKKNDLMQLFPAKAVLFPSFKILSVNDVCQFNKHITATGQSSTRDNLNLCIWDPDFMPCPGRSSLTHTRSPYIVMVIFTKCLPKVPTNSSRCEPVCMQTRQSLAIACCLTQI